MFVRNITNELIDMANCYPIVTLTGPRQSGKTTLVRHIFPNKPYINLELPELKRYVDEDPKGLLSQYPDGAIIDEVQKCPELLSYLQVIVDEKQKQGMYILTGSQNLLLANKVSQSLAGRTAILNLLPLSLSELKDSKVYPALNDLLVNGFYPRIYKDKIKAQKHHRDYLQTYVERDVRELLNIKNLTLFSNFMRIIASRVGQLLNINNIANELGISNHTVKEWLSILEASYIITLIRPFYENFGKRIIKSPKLYFIDIGLACYLLDISHADQVARDPLRGNLFENLVVIEILKAKINKGDNSNLYFYRDSNQKEIDLLHKIGSDLIPIEIKSSYTFNHKFLQSLKYFNDLTKIISPKGYVVYAGEMEMRNSNYKILNFWNSSACLDSE